MTFMKDFKKAKFNWDVRVSNSQAGIKTTKRKRHKKTKFRTVNGVVVSTRKPITTISRIPNNNPSTRGTELKTHK